MAYETGTATDHVDLFNKLYTFLTSNSALVTASQQWSRVTTVGNTPPLAAGTPADNAGVTGAVMLKGPGLSGTDEVFVSMYLYDNTANNRQMIHLMGHDGVLSDNDTYQNHVNSSSRKGFLVWNQSMTYWFVANGRRFYGVVKCGTTYESFYCGFYLPFASPVNQPYPLMIGGTTGKSTDDVSLSTATADHRAYPDPGDTGGVNANEIDFTSLAIKAPGGDWLDLSNCRNTTVAGNNTNQRRQHLTFPYNSITNTLSPTDSQSFPGATSTNESWQQLNNVFLNSQKPLLDGTYLLTPVMMLSSDLQENTDPVGIWGVMDGIFHVSGYNNSAENIVQLSGVDHLVVQNVNRTSMNSYFAMALE